MEGASMLIGGPPGEHARIGAGRSWWTPLRVLMAFTVVACLLGYLQKVPCRDTRNWTQEYQYTRMCYSDVVALFGQEGLATGKHPFLDYPTEYPPLIGAAMQLGSWAAGFATPSEPVFREEGGTRVPAGYTLDHRTAAFFDVTALLFLVAACVTVACTALAAGRARIWDASLFALAPVLILHLLTNWDILAVALAAGGLLAWSRRWPALAGVLFGLGTATKFYPVFFLLPLAVLSLRAGRRGVGEGGVGADRDPQGQVWEAASDRTRRDPRFTAPGVPAGSLEPIWEVREAQAREPFRAFARTLVTTVVTAAAIWIPLWLVAGYFKGDQRVGDSIWTTLRNGGDWVGLLDGRAGDATNAMLRFVDLNSERGADWDSLAFATTWLAGSFSTRMFGAVHLVALAVAGITLAAAGFAAARRWPRVRLPVAAAALAGWLATVVAVPPVLTSVRENGIPTARLNGISMIALAVLLLGVAALGWFAPRRPRLPQLLFLTLVVFLITNKVFSPQYSLWLVPLAALARPRWPAFLAWQASEAYVLLTRFMHFVYNDTAGADGIDRGWFVSAVVLRDVMLCVLAALVVREILRPELDIVRVSGADDPAGGVLDGVRERRRQLDGDATAETRAGGLAAAVSRS